MILIIMIYLAIGMLVAGTSGIIYERFHAIRMDMSVMVVVTLLWWVVVLVMITAFIRGFLLAAIGHNQDDPS